MPCYYTSITGGTLLLVQLNTELLDKKSSISKFKVRLGTFKFELLLNYGLAVYC